MFKRIMVAVDNSEAAKKVISMAKDMANTYEAELYVVYVIEPLSAQVVGEYYTPELETAMSEQAEAILEEAVSPLKGGNVSYKTKLLYGHPVTQICEEAKVADVDLIVLGSRGLGPVRELFLGSVSHGVSQRSDVSVLIVK